MKLLYDPEPMWKDGLWRALQELQDIDATIIWCGSGSPQLNYRTNNERVLWLYAGGQPRDVSIPTVVEDLYSQEQFRKIGVETQIAFGVNTDIMRSFKREKVYDVIFPAAFAKWKRHNLLIEWVKAAGINPQKVLVIGQKQEVEQECFEECEEAGFIVHDKVEPELLSVLYNESKECWIPSETMGGSQRTLMEARACGIPVRVAKDNPRLNQMLTEPVRSHYFYANALRQILE